MTIGARLGAASIVLLSALSSTNLPTQTGSSFAQSSPVRPAKDRTDSGRLRSDLAGKVAFARDRDVDIWDFRGRFVARLNPGGQGDRSPAQDDFSAAITSTPLAFSPDGAKLAAGFWYQGRIYVFDLRTLRSSWITRSWEMKTAEEPTWRYRLRQVLWAPDSRHLAVVTSCGGPDSTILLSIYDLETETLRSVYRHPCPDGSYDDRYQLEWRSDSEALYAAFANGRLPADLLEVNARSGEARRIFVAASRGAIRGLANDPMTGGLIFAACVVSADDTIHSSTIYSFDGQRTQSLRALPAIVEGLEPSPGGSRLAISNYRDLLVTTGMDSLIWNATFDIANKFFIGRPRWVDDHRVVFAVVLRTHDTRIYLADAESKTRHLLIDHDIASGPLMTVPGKSAFVYPRISWRGPWKVAQGGSPFWQKYRFRTVGVDLDCWDLKASQSFALTHGGVIPAYEDEGNFSVYVGPITFDSR